MLTGQIRELPKGENGGVSVRKIQKSPMYTTAAIQNVLSQDVTANEVMKNFMMALPFMAQNMNLNLMNQQRQQTQAAAETETAKDDDKKKEEKKGRKSGRK